MPAIRVRSRRPMPLLRRLLPRPFVEAIVRRRMLRAMEREDARLSATSRSLREEHLRHATVLADSSALLARLPKGGVVAEIGVAEGNFSAAILAETTPSRLHLIDLWGSSIARFGDAGHARVIARFAPEIAAGRVSIHRGLSWDEVGKLDDRSLDWAYVDAAHDYGRYERVLG